LEQWWGVAAIGAWLIFAKLGDRTAYREHPESGLVFLNGLVFEVPQ
jgi:hypothetical protein